MRSALVQSRTPLASHSCTFGKKLGIICIIYIILFSPYFCLAQLDSTAPPLLSKKQKTNRQIFVGAVNVVAYGGSLIILSNTWYKDYPHTSFQ
jgi:hypothetical protein